MARLLVCVTFDFDAMSGLMARGLTSPNYISRGEFGPAAIPRILKLLDKYGVKSTFFNPGFTIETYPAQNEAILKAAHEIGHHGWTHLPPNKMTREQEEANLVRGNETIKKLTGKYARGYRSPSWDLSQNTLDLLLKHGFAYESSLMGDDYTPYRVRQGDIVDIEKPLIFGKPTRLIEMPIAWSLDDFPHFEFLRMETQLMPGLMNANHVMENWINDFVYMKEHFEWGVLTYTLHPYVIGRGHRMMAFEKLLKAVAEGGGTFVTMEDAALEYDKRAPFKG
jgi:peptidoglycan/xylan/chitin deacetylase (PgdA/CDA1 family)